MSTNYDGAKYALAACVGVITLVAGVSPWCIAHYIASRKALDIISAASAASAGVVVGAFLCHLLPEAAASYGDYLSEVAGPDARITKFPFAGAVCGSVLALLVTLDGLIVKRGYDGSGHGHGSGGAVVDAASHDHITQGFQQLVAHTAAHPPGRKVTPAQTYGTVHRQTSSEKHSGGSSGQHFGTLDLGMRAEQSLAQQLGDDGDDVELPSVQRGRDAAHLVVNAPAPALAFAYEELRSASSESEGQSLLKKEQHGAATAAAVKAGNSRKLLLRAWVFFIALSLHGMFDGLSVGSETDPAGLTSTMIAVASHKIFDGLSLGCALFPAPLPKCHRWALLIISSATTPIGIGIGMVAAENVDATHVRLVNGIVLSMAAGSFAFISLMELLPSALADGRKIPTKLFCFIAGFVAMAVLAAYV